MLSIVLNLVFALDVYDCKDPLAVSKFLTLVVMLLEKVLSEPVLVSINDNLLLALDVYELKLVLIEPLAVSNELILPLALDV